MSITAGSRIGAYEVVAAIGAGGMGEVYRARDTKLQREVALKVLPDAFASDAERLGRFQREAHVLAALNHSNIAAIYGVEDSGDVRALVMELVDGETLAERIVRGPIALDDALSIARQIADALDAAHEHGIVHRDLKPANIKLRHDGTVKVLDFGLAKLVPPVGATGTAVTMSPTITSPALATGVGVLLGTAAYMAPEQAKGRDADKRSDVWAFGCVLFEMLTGARAFPGDDITETLAAVIKTEPELSRAPHEVRRLLAACLAKNPRQRLQSIGDAWLLLDKAPVSPPTARSHRRGWIGAVVACALLTILLSLWGRANRAAPQSAAGEAGRQTQSRCDSDQSRRDRSIKGRYTHSVCGARRRRQTEPRDESARSRGGDGATRHRRRQRTVFFAERAVDRILHPERS
jgi:eukaryotic-like serine/threonine-protein kinase